MGYMDDHSLYKVGEVAAKLRISPLTVKRWIKQGKLQAFVLPSGLYRIPKEALSEYIIDSPSKAQEEE